MMKFVRAFHSMDLKREFLRSLGLFNELLLLEEELGNFMEAANIAKLIGDILLEADLLGKAGKFREAYELLLVYVLANSLWSVGSKGWPLKLFVQKDVLLRRALSFAKEVSSNFYELACTEVEILSNEHSTLHKIMNQLKSSRRYRSIMGEILCLWKLLDAHFQLNSSKYVWQDNVIVDSVEGMILKNQISVETLFHCWTCWKDKIVDILDCLPCLKSNDVHQQRSYGEFALNYLGVQRQISNLNATYLLLIPNANWVIKMGERSLKKDGKKVSLDVHVLVSAAQSYWRSELLSVGMDVLRNLDALYEISVNKVLSEFCQFRSLMLIYEVSKFLLESKCFSHSHGNLKTLEKFLRLPVDCFFHYLVPLDSKKSLTRSMASIRATQACQALVKEVIYENIRWNDKLTYGQIGRVAVLILGMTKPKNELCVEIMRRFEENLPRTEFIWSLCGNSGEEISQDNEASKALRHMFKFYEALRDTYNANWMKEVDYISPNCFMFLIERLLILTSCWKGFIFATKSSFIEWLIYQDENALPNLSLLAGVSANLEAVHEFVAYALHQLLYNQKDTKNWIGKSKLNEKVYFPLLVLRLIVSICLLHLSSGKCLALLNNLLGKSHITEQLPLEFFNVLQKGRKRLGLKVFAEAFKKVDNPLVIARLQNKSSEILCPDAVFVDLMICQTREHVLQALFPNRVETMSGETAAAILEASDSTTPRAFPSTSCSSPPNTSSAPVADQASNTGIEYEISKLMDVDCFWHMLESLKLAIDESHLSRVLHSSLMVKDVVDPYIGLLNSSISGSLPQNPFQLANKNEMAEVVSLLDEMKQLSAASSASYSVVENHIPVIGELTKKILSKRPKVEQILGKLFLLHTKNAIADNEPIQASSAASNDQGQDDLEESKDNVSNNSKGAINSGQGNINENTKGKNKKSKKNKGGRKGRK